MKTSRSLTSFTWLRLPPDEKSIFSLVHSIYKVIEIHVSTIVTSWNSFHMDINFTIPRLLGGRAGGIWVFARNDRSSFDQYEVSGVL